ncbi:PST family polysaccharide transporter, partial [Lacticaseibacillus paracasei subsp. paracasei Lpp126]
KIKSVRKICTRTLPTNQLTPFTTSVILGAVANMILNIPLILLFKSDGAMVATVLSEFLVTAYQLSKIKDQLNIFSLFNEVWKYFLAALIMGISVRVFISVLSLSNVVGLLGTAVYGVMTYTIALLMLRPRVLLNMISTFRRSRG